MASVTTSQAFKKVTLTGPQETLLATLHGRAQDAARPDPILGDKWAADILAKIDYDFTQQSGMDSRGSIGVAVRARLLDTWAKEFLETNASATVLHMACGLDTRHLRVNWGPDVRWIDIDLPDVVDLRRELIPVPEGDYILRAASATDIGGWITDIPTDRPIIIILEGLTMYLQEDVVRNMFQTLVKTFIGRGGQIVFDAYGTVGIQNQHLVKTITNTGSTVHWGLDDAKLLEEWCPGLKLSDQLRSLQLVGMETLPWIQRMSLWLLSSMPAYSKYLDFSRIYRYKF
jgi:O-methyltransferase involved in polyketide biosynthesis